MVEAKGHLLRRIGSSIVDGALEFTGGLLGSYLGAMVAALVTVMHEDSAAETMQSSMRSGFGVGFAFWALSISFLNRVLIQGISRASIGKKLFRLELVSARDPLTWGRVVGRWLLSVGSLVVFGAGYWFALLNRERRTLHDLVAGTDVVPAAKEMSAEPGHIATVIELRPKAKDSSEDEKKAA
jgi:uncharacterized RDD family membrane protein YckC